MHHGSGGSSTSEMLRKRQQDARAKACIDFTLRLLKLLYFPALFALLLHVARQFTPHQYQVGDVVTVWINRVGPYNNPQETYEYFSLPFCRPSGVKLAKTRDDSLAIALGGDKVTDSGMNLYFKRELPVTQLCAVTPNAKQVKRLKRAVENNYWYQMYIDELPLWGLIGEKRGNNDEYYVFAHKEFSIGYNGDHIVEVNLTASNPVPIKQDQRIPFTYSAKWVSSTRTFSRRFDRYLDFNFFEHRVHRYSLLYSIMLVLILCCIVGIVLSRTLKHDIERLAQQFRAMTPGLAQVSTSHSFSGRRHGASSVLDDEDPDSSSVSDLDLDLHLADLAPDDVLRDRGWRMLHNDVFRSPPRLALFAAALGLGAQLLTLAAGVLFTMYIKGTTYGKRGGLPQLLLWGYFATTVVAGYVSGSVYKVLAERQKFSGFKRTMAYVSLFVPSLWICYQLGNMIMTWWHGATAIVNMAEALHLLSLFVFVQIPLVVIGTIIARLLHSTDNESRARSRNVMIRRPIAVGPFYSSPWFIALVAGALPFVAVFIETHFVFSSFWNHKFYYVYGILISVFVILLLITACVSIVATYLLLNWEDWRWHWVAFGSGASLGLYVFMFSVYYYCFYTRMSGALQASIYFGSTLLISAALAALNGAVSYFAADAFVRRIYKSRHVDG